MNRLVLTTLLISALSFASCNSTGPSGPSNSALGVASLSIVPAIPAITLGSTATLRAVKRFPDGHTEGVQPAWSSDSPDIASVGSQGVVQAAAVGTTTVRATFESLGTSMALRVV